MRGLIWQIDLSLVQALDELTWGQVDQADVTQAVEQRIRDGLADADAGDAVYYVIQAFKMLDVDGGVDIDACIKQVDDILPTPLMAAARRVAVGKFVDQGHLRTPLKDGVNIQFLQLATLVFNPLTWDQFQIVYQCSGF